MNVKCYYVRRLSVKALKGLKAIFFDLDETLTDISERQAYAIQETASYFGVQVPKNDVKKQLGKALTNPHELFLEVYSSVFNYFGIEFTGQVYQHLVSSFVEKHHLSSLKKNVKSTIKALSRKYSLFCVTSRETLLEVELELEFLGIRGLFESIVTREVAAEHFGLQSIPFLPFEQQRRKLYECALEISGCSPSEVVVVGDMASELKPARELGIMVVGLKVHGKKQNLGKVTDVTIMGLSELKSILAIVLSRS